MREIAMFAARAAIAAWLLIEIYHGSRVALVVMLALMTAAHEVIGSTLRFTLRAERRVDAP